MTQHMEDYGRLWQCLVVFCWCSLVTLGQWGHLLVGAALVSSVFGGTQRRNQIQVLISQNATVAEYRITSRLERSLFSSSSSCRRRFNFTIWGNAWTQSRCSETRHLIFQNWFIPFKLLLPVVLMRRRPTGQTHQGSNPRSGLGVSWGD